MTRAARVAGRALLALGLCALVFAGVWGALHAMAEHQALLAARPA